MKKTIGILAHVDAGKTTFSEQLLFHANAIKKTGRVDHRDAFMDTHGLEKQRGITIFADQAQFSYNDSIYYLIDTPGHVDFSPEMVRAVQVMDYAIIIVSAVEGIEGHTERVWEILKEYQIPVFFFINKTDREGADVEAVIKEIQKNFTEDVIDISKNLSGDQMSNELVEFIAERDENLLEYYFEKGYQKDLWFNVMKKLISENKIYPYSSGSALLDQGIKDFLEKFDRLTTTSYEAEGDFSGRVFKIRHEANGSKITFIKALSGSLKIRDTLSYGDPSDRKEEKVTQIRLYNGNNYTMTNEVTAGELFAVMGLTESMIGDGVGSLMEKSSLQLETALRSKVVFDPRLNVREVLQIFRILEAEDPSLNVIWEEKLQEIQIHVMGTIQIEVLQQILADRFGLEIQFEKPEIVYKETIANPVIGYGHFEPLRHYAEVHLKLEPLPRNRGIAFSSECHPDDLSVATQNLVKQHIFERDHHCLLTGSPLTDIKITLINGREHVKHTSGGDFREATFRALRQALEKAENILLEPYYHFKIKVNLEQMGKIISDIQMAHGEFDPPMTEGDKVTITGQVPVATFMDYPTEFKAYTSGKGSLSLTLAGYALCHNSEEVIKKIGYKKDADPIYTSSSIFCSKGQSFSVPWHEAEKMMHALK